MTHEQRLFKVMTAVRNCLDSCERSPQPTEALSRFVEHLRRDPCWNDSEVQEVEKTAGLALTAGRQRQFKDAARNKGQSSDAKSNRHWS